MVAVPTVTTLALYDNHQKNAKRRDSRDNDGSSETVWFGITGFLLVSIVIIFILFFAWWLYAALTFDFEPAWYRVLVLAIGFLLDPIIGLIAAYLLRKK